MTETMTASEMDIDSKLWALSSQLRGRVALGDGSILVPVLYFAWLRSNGSSTDDVCAVLADSHLPGWAQDYVAGCIDYDVLSWIDAQLGSYTPDELRELALASFDTLSENLGRVSGDFVTPGCISALAVEALGLNGTESVADFGCGWGGFLDEASGAAGSLYGLDVNPRAAAFAAMRMNLLGAACEVERGDMLAQGTGRSFDRCFAQIPFGMRLPNLNLKGTAYEGALSGKGPIGRPASGDWVLVQRVLDGTAEGGRAVVVMGNGATFNHGDAEARAHFARGGRLEAVVALPARLFSFTGISSTMVIFGDGSKGVRMVDATDLSVPGRRTDDMGPDEVAEVMRRLSGDGPMSKVVSLGDLERRDWSLAPQRYLRREIELENATPLGDLAVAIERGAGLRAAELDELETPEDTGISYLPVSSVADGRVGGDLPHITSLDPRHDRACLEDGDLVMTKIGSPVRVAVAEVPEGQTVVATGNLYVVRLDTERIDPYFLAAFLSSDDGQELACGLATGTTIPTIALRDLRELEVPVPAMDVQRKVAERYQAALDEIEVHKVKLERARAAAAGAYDEEMGR